MLTRVTVTVVCCILVQILCVVSQKSFSFWGTLSPRPLTGAPHLDPHWGTTARHPTGALPLDPLGSPDPQSSFMSPQESCEIDTLDNDIHLLATYSKLGSPQ